MGFFTFSFPTPTLFGSGCLDELPARLKSLGTIRTEIATAPKLEEMLALIT